MRVDRWLGGLALCALVLAVTGCGTGASSTAAAPATAVAVSNTSAVVGKWTGLLELEGGGDREDFVDLTIAPDGTYRAGAARTIGLMDAGGKDSVADGKNLLDGARGGKATGTLYEGAQRSLVVVGAAPNGRRFMVRLRPSP